MIALRIVVKLTESVQDARRRRRRHQLSASDTTTSEPTITVTDNRRPSTCRIREPSSISAIPLLYALCKQWAWPAITFRCETHPQEASAQFTDERGDTALHWVVFGKPPVAVIHALVKACPALAFTSNRGGQLPIHVAASYRASGAVIRALVHSYPNGAGAPVPGKGSCPLHLMCDYGSSLDSIRAILESKAGVSSLRVNDRIFDRTPLRILNLRKNMYAFHLVVSDLRNIRRTQKELKEAMLLEGAYDQSQLDALENQVEPFREYEFWKTASLLIHTEYTNTIVNEDAGSINTIIDEGTHYQSFILNACTTLCDHCPPSLTELALLLHPEQLLHGDEQGRLPLHNAAQRPDSTVLLDLLYACPQATKIRDANGFLPLQLAIQSGRGWNDGVEQMIILNPASIEALDLDDRLYPRVWYKLLQQESADAIFQSIRAKPNLFVLAR